MKQAWYGPLVELGAISSHAGCYIQLVVFVVQSHPPERMTTMKGKQLTRSIQYVGDSSCSNVKVSLWNNIAGSHDISAGDIIFLQNVKIVKFCGRMELTSAQSSNIVPLLKMQDFFSYQGVKNAMKTWQHGPLVEDKVKSIACWAQQTQLTLLSLLYQISKVSKRVEDPSKVSSKNVDIGEQGENPASEAQVVKCSSILDAVSVQKHCVVEFYATIGEIFLLHPKSSSKSNLSLDGCLLFSKNLKGEQAQKLIMELLCLGCETCGRELVADKNSVYEGCRCGTMSLGARDHPSRKKQKQACRIFRPFFLHVGDQSGQTTVLVRHAAAARMFGNISAESVYQGLSCQGKQDEDNIMMDYSLIFTILLRSLLSSKNSPFRIQAVCNPPMRTSLEHLRLASISMPIIT